MTNEWNPSGSSDPRRAKVVPLRLGARRHEYERGDGCSDSRVSVDGVRARGAIVLALALGVPLAILFSFISRTATASGDQPHEATTRLIEQWVEVPMPAGVHIESSEIDGPVFADASGHTLYSWPFKRMRVGYSGEQKGKPACYDDVLRETAGLMSPYPAGVILPELDTRPACTTLWKPFLAPADAKPVGKWTLLERKDGTKQWAYHEQALYTSSLDKKPGDVYGGRAARNRKDDDEEGGGGGGDSAAGRAAVGPPPKVPPGFDVKTTVNGRLLTTNKSFSVYVYDKDTPGKSACEGACAQTWKPLIAPDTAIAQGEWSTIERGAGLKQWAFRKQPLYTYELDPRPMSLEGSDVPGWHNVYTQPAPPPPASFTRQDTIAGQVLADAHGKTIYIYHCADDSQDQLSCETPDDTQVYRLALCGRGDPERCAANWPYVLAEKGATSPSRTWSVLSIDPKTGHRASAGAPGALLVWAYRDRPVYTFSGDKKPGDVNGDAIGEWRGQRNGLKAYWLRDDFFGGGGG